MKSTNLDQLELVICHPNDHTSGLIGRGEQTLIIVEAHVKHRRCVPLKLINNRTFLIIHVVDVQTGVLGARAHKTLALLFCVAHLGTKH